MALNSNSGSNFTAASQVAKVLGSSFSEIAIVTASLTTSGTTITAAHGLTGTPDFVVATGSFGVTLGAEKDSISWTTTGTTVTFITANTMATTRPITAIVGVLA